jgi:hypothetical protein
MTVQQAARLCVVSGKKFAAVDMCRRLGALEFLKIDDLFRDRSKLVLSLTDAGRRFAVDRLARGHRGGLRDEAGDEFVLHTLRGADLYLDIVAKGAKDWPTVRANAERFDWYSQNENVDFVWRMPTSFARTQSVERRVVPDAVLETESERLMIEVERSTKTLRPVMAKVENYCHVFSPLKNVKEGVAYRHKYSDDRAPMVVFMFDTEERARNVAELVEKRKRQQGFSIPNIFVGTLDETAIFIAKRIGLDGRRASVRVDPALQFAREVRAYVDHIVNRTGMSSSFWPANWKTVMKHVYGPEEWPRTEKQLDARIAASRARQAAEKNQRGAT